MLTAARIVPGIRERDGSFQNYRSNDADSARKLLKTDTIFTCLLCQGPEKVKKRYYFRNLSDLRQRTRRVNSDLGSNPVCGRWNRSESPH